jgi:hypothetical protein
MGVFSPLRAGTMIDPVAGQVDFVATVMSRSTGKHMSDCIYSRADTPAHPLRRGSGMDRNVIYLIGSP